MNKRIQAFTLVELLVAMALFVSLMGLTAISFQRVSKGGQKALQVLELHSKADSILRNMEFDLHNAQQTTAMHFQTMVQPYTITFMKPTTDQDETFFHNGITISSTDRFSNQTERLTDFVWVRWSWEKGAFSRGHSRMNQNIRGRGTHNYVSNTQKYLESVDLKHAVPHGIQNNGIPPTPQQHYDFFEGSGASVYAISNDGTSAALPGQKMAVYQVVNASYDSNSYKSCELFDMPWSPWRTGDYRHLYTTLETGNDVIMPTAYAVRNADGRSINKDRLNLVGSDETDINGRKIYPSQVRFLFDGIEFLVLEGVKRNGEVLDSATDDSDRIADGNASIDISGVDPEYGTGYELRPQLVRLSYLLHGIEGEFRDDEDYDGDNDYDEKLSAAIRAVVEAEGGTRLEKIASFKRHALKNGFTSILITQSIKLGL